MVWSFLWRFAFYGFVLAYGSTLLVGFFVGIAGGGAVMARDIGMWVQGAALLAGALAAWAGADKAR